MISPASYDALRRLFVHGTTTLAPYGLRIVTNVSAPNVPRRTREDLVRSGYVTARRLAETSEAMSQYFGRVDYWEYKLTEKGRRALIERDPCLARLPSDRVES